MHEGKVGVSGELALVHNGNVIDIKSRKPIPEAHKFSWRAVYRDGFPHFGLPMAVNVWRFKNLLNLFRGIRQVMIARATKTPHFYGELRLRHHKALEEKWVDYGLASMRVVTTAGVNFIVARMTGSSAANIANYKYHGIGTGTNAEASSDTALQTEITTAYNPDNTRATATQATGGSSNVYRTDGTNTVDATVAATEVGIFDQAATGGGSLLDRFKFSVINLLSNDSLESIADITFAAGG